MIRAVAEHAPLALLAMELLPHVQKQATLHAVLVLPAVPTVT